MRTMIMTMIMPGPVTTKKTMPMLGRAIMMMMAATLVEAVVTTTMKKKMPWTMMMMKKRRRYASVDQICHFLLVDSS
jgi:hypothetical protein